MARPPEAHAQSAGEGAWQWAALPPGGGWVLRHTSPPDTQHLAAWRIHGPLTVQADEIGLHSGQRPGPMGTDHVRVPCVGKLSFSIATPTQPHSRGWRLLPVDNELAYTVVRCGGGGAVFRRAAGGGVWGGRQKPAGGCLLDRDAPSLGGALVGVTPALPRSTGLLFISICELTDPETHGRSQNV